MKKKNKKKQLTPANLCYSSRHKRDNYWCGGRRTERRTRSDSRGESRRRCVNIAAKHAVTLVIDRQQERNEAQEGKAASIILTRPCKKER